MKVICDAKVRLGMAAGIVVLTHATAGCFGGDAGDDPRWNGQVAVEVDVPVDGLGKGRPGLSEGSDWVPVISGADAGGGKDSAPGADAGTGTEPAPGTTPEPGGGTEPPPGTGSAAPQEVDCTHTGSGNLYEVGEGQPLASLGEVPWNALGPGDMVRVHWRAEPYREKILLSTRGEPGNPIRLCGVAGPDGELPVLDGHGATTSAHQDWIPWVQMQDLGLVLVVRDDNTGYYSRPGHIAIEGFHLQGAKQDVPYTAADGSARAYGAGAACVYIAHGDHITVRGSVLTDCSNGFFVLSKSEIEETLSREILFETNSIHGNGNVDDWLRHNAYIQALGVVVQYNYFGRPRPGSLGANLKDRSSGTVVRYNWFEGGARILDLVDAQDHAQEAVQDPRYRETFVYGNVLVSGPSDAKHLVHYGGDTGGFEHNFRKGTLYFHYNTVLMEGDVNSQWLKTLFDASTPDETVDMRNNVVQMTGTSQLVLMRTSGHLSVGTNWISSGWQEGTTEFDGSVSGAENFLEGSNPMLDPQTKRPIDGSPLLDRASALAPAALDHGATMEYCPVATGVARTAHGSAMDLGAFEGP
ncbi:MAG: hypothetical protein ACOC1F_02710 [Myxococcota bacterium]